MVNLELKVVVLHYRIVMSGLNFNLAESVNLYSRIYLLSLTWGLKDFH